MVDFLISKESRIKVGAIIIALSLLTIVAALAYHQVIRHKFFFDQSEDNRIRVQPVIPKRGLIYDRHMNVIADNILSFTVSVVPFECVDDITIPRLADLLDMDTASIEKRIKANYVSRFMPAPVKRGQDIKIISILEERMRAYPGITYSVESVRRYAPGSSAETFVGYVGEISPEEIKSESKKDYRSGSLIGKKGVEKVYDRLLRGLEGTEYIEVSAKGQIVGPYEGKERIAAIPGNDLVLTIDMNLQNMIVECFDSIHHCGSIVAIDPRNAEILALASFPHFDPNIFSGVISPEDWQAITSDTNHPLLNRPLAGLYPPGSTTKLLTAGAALEMGLVTDRFLLKPCTGGMRFGNRTFHCWDLAGHGRLNVYQAIEQSCDVYFYQLGQMMGVRTFADYAKKCGFGRQTGIDITGELAGIVPNHNYYDSLYGTNKWSPYLVLNLAIGQGEFTITPLQLAQFYCGLANEGKVYRPHILKKIIYPNGNSRNIEPELSFNLPFSEKTLGILNQALELVVHGEDGTAMNIRTQKYKISGKTGTAQNPHGENHSWFVGMAPSEAPEIVIVALVENAGHGSDVAAPLVRKILDFYILGDQTGQNHIAEHQEPAE